MFLECVSVPGSSAGLNSDPWWSDTLSERVFQVKDETNSQQVVLVQILKVQTGRKKKELNTIHFGFTQNTKITLKIHSEGQGRVAHAQ